MPKKTNRTNWCSTWNKTPAEDSGGKASLAGRAGTQRQHALGLLLDPGPQASEDVVRRHHQQHRAVRAGEIRSVRAEAFEIERTAMVG